MGRICLVWDFVVPWTWIVSVHHPNEGGIGKSTPLPSRFPSTIEMSLGKSRGHRGWISQYLPRLDGARIKGIVTLWQCIVNHNLWQILIVICKMSLAPLHTANVVLWTLCASICSLYTCTGYIICTAKCMKWFTHYTCSYTIFCTLWFFMHYILHTILDYTLSFAHYACLYIIFCTLLLFIDYILYTMIDF